MPRLPDRAIRGAALLWLAGVPGAVVRAQPAAPDSTRDSTTAVDRQPARDAARDGARVHALAPVRVMGRGDRLLGTAASTSEGRVLAAEMRSRPMRREGEVLEAVPGMIVTQHSGEGKANQYFVRGFNLDHGTDFQARVDGVPVNLPTHGHGQGYTDLSFLVLELVDHLEYRLGVHHVELGDFASAGGADVRLVRTLDRPLALVEVGQNGLARLVAGASRRIGAGTWLAGGELKRYDGPWVRAQELRKASGLARYSWSAGASRVSLLALGYRNRWNASDQIPERAVAARRISRLGQVDTTLGGSATRLSLAASWDRAAGRGTSSALLYLVRSELDLFSNFTYFLEDPGRGDQFEQTDRRTVVGGEASHARAAGAFGASHVVRAGVQARADLIDEVGLFHSVARARTGTVRDDAVDELSTGAWVAAESRWRPWLRSVVGVRGDALAFDVRSDRPENSGRRTAAMASPKASLVLSPDASTELYVSGGLGFHSNDARGTVIRVDPATGAPAERVDPLVRSRGGELGARLEPAGGALRDLRATASAWVLDLASELLFVGDAGTTEASAASRRAGLTIGASFRTPRLPGLALDGDVSLVRARFRGVPAGADRIPGAVERVIAAGVTWDPPRVAGTRRGPFGALRLRHVGPYPLVEDGSVRGGGSTLVGAEVGMALAGDATVRVSALNLLDARADDVRYVYASRLPGEAAAGVVDVHGHPAPPRQLRVAIEWGI